MLHFPFFKKNKRTKGNNRLRLNVSANFNRIHINLTSRQDKLNEGQVLLDDLSNCRPLEKPMVETTAKKVQQLNKSLLSEGHIDKMTAKWLSLTSDPPRIPLFYTITKIHKPTLVGTERISAFVDHLIQPIAQQQTSYLKDTTDFINFIERIKLLNSAILVSMDVTSLYTTTTRGYYHCMYVMHTKNFTKETFQSLPGF